MFADAPRALAGVAQHHRPFVLNSSSLQLAHLGPWKLPLFPDVGSQASEYPVVQFARKGGTHSDSEVLRPTSNVLIEFVYDLPDASPAFSGGQSTHLLPEAP